MHAVVVSVTVHDRDAAISELQEQVVPTVSGAPGFVAGYWIALPNGQGRGTIVFDSEGAAQAAAGQVQTPRAAVAIDSVEVGEVVANA
jgi:hypothetical protein